MSTITSPLKVEADVIDHQTVHGTPEQVLDAVNRALVRYQPLGAYGRIIRLADFQAELGDLNTITTDTVLDHVEAWFGPQAARRTMNT